MPIVLVYLCQNLQRGVGLATRVSAARSISYLAEKYPNILQSNVSGKKAFKLIIGTLTTSIIVSNAIFKSFTSAQGALAKILPSEVLIEETSALIDKYKSLGRDDDRFGPVIATCLHEIIKKGGDSLPSSHQLWFDILAISFLGTFDPDVDAKATMISIFNEALPMSGSGNKVTAISRSMIQIITIIKGLLDDLSWRRRRQGLEAFNDLLNCVPSRELIAPNIGHVVACLCKMVVKPHVWTGKELVYESLTLVAKNCFHHVSCENQVDDRSLLLVIDSDGQSVHSIRVRATEDMDDEQHQDNPLTHLSTYQWRIFAQPLVALYLDHFQKILKENTSFADNKEYYLSIARAMASLPWAEIAEANQLYFYSIVIPSLMELSDVVERNGNEGESRVAKKHAVEDHVTLKPKQSATVTKPKNYSLFGDRYGASKSVAIDSSMRKIVKPAPVIATRDIAIEEEKHAIKALSTFDPAFRMKFLECISAGWTRHTNEVTKAYSLTYARKLISWILGLASTNEIWSIRFVALQVLFKLVASEYATDANPINHQEVLRFLASTMEDETKFPRVRQAAIEVAENLLRNSSTVKNDEISLEILRLLVRVGGNDSQPSVVSAASSLSRVLPS